MSEKKTNLNKTVGDINLKESEHKPSWQYRWHHYSFLSKEDAIKAFTEILDKYDEVCGINEEKKNSCIIYQTHFALANLYFKQDSQS